MTPQTVFITGIFLLIVSLPASMLGWRKIFTLLAMLGSGFLGLIGILWHPSGNEALHITSFQLGIFPVEIGVSWLSSIFLILLSVGCIFGLAHGYAYLKDHKHNLRSHGFFLALLVISLHLTVLARDALMLIFAWELMGFSSFLAILVERDEATWKAAKYYLIFMQAGAAVLLTGIAMAYANTGSLRFDDWTDLPATTAFVLMTGFAFKAGFFPFHSWLPVAHPMAPSHVSGMMSGLLTKTGIYGILMILLCFQPPIASLYIFGVIALITALTGVFHALAETDIKRILAWSSIENIGIIGLGIVFAWLGMRLDVSAITLFGIMGALLHSMNHSLFKPMLFYLSGNVQHQAQERDINRLGGLQKKMPVTGGLFLAGSMAISGLPFMNGFISEFLIFLAILEGFRVHNIGINIAAIVGLSGLAYVASIALFAFARMYGLAFLGTPRTEKAMKVKEAKRGLWIVPSILAGLCLIGGMAGDYVLAWLHGFLPSSILDSDIDYNQLLEHFQPFRLVMVVTLVFFLILFIWRRRKVRTQREATWGCGYEKPSAKMQYTGTSFVHPVEPILNLFTGRQREFNFDSSYFPTRLSFVRAARDRVQKSLIAPVVQSIHRFLDLFAGVQSGRTQVYITYGLVFLVAVLIWVVVGES